MITADIQQLVIGTVTGLADQAGLLRGVHYSLEWLDLSIDGCHVTAVRGEIERGPIDVATRDENFRFRRRMNFARQDAIRADAPVLGTTIFLEHLQPLPSPRPVRRDAEAFSDDAVDLSPEQQLVHRELLAGAERSRGLVADLENGGPRHRLFVVLDLVLHVKLVLVL